MGRAWLVSDRLTCCFCEVRAQGGCQGSAGLGLMGARGQNSAEWAWVSLSALLALLRHEETRVQEVSKSPLHTGPGPWAAPQLHCLVTPFCQQLSFSLFLDMKY